MKFAILLAILLASMRVAEVSSTSTHNINRTLQDPSSNIEDLQLQWLIDGNSWQLNMDSTPYVISVLHGTGAGTTASETNIQWSNKRFEFYYDPSFHETGDVTLNGSFPECWSSGASAKLGTYNGIDDVENNIIRVLGVTTVSTPTEGIQQSSIAFQFGTGLPESDIYHQVSEVDGMVNAYVKFCVAFSLSDDSAQISLSKQLENDNNSNNDGAGPNLTTDMNYRELSVAMGLQFDGSLAAGDESNGQVMAIKTRPADRSNEALEEPLVYTVEAKINPSDNRRAFVSGDTIPICACATDYPLTAVGQFQRLAFEMYKDGTDTMPVLTPAPFLAPVFRPTEAQSTPTSPSPAPATNDNENDNNNGSDNNGNSFDFGIFTSNGVGRRSLQGEEPVISQVVIDGQVDGEPDYDEAISKSGGCYNEVDSNGEPVEMMEKDPNELYRCCCWDTVLGRAFYDEIEDGANANDVAITGAIDMTIGSGVNVRRQLFSSIDHSSVRELQGEVTIRGFETMVTLVEYETAEDASSTLGYLSVGIVISLLTTLSI